MQKNRSKANLDNSSPDNKVSVLFVCLGNICRSPSAHGIFQKLVNDANLTDRIYVDSAGTGDWHIGRPPDARATEHALRRGFDLSVLTARQVARSDFHQFDYILGMDRQNMIDMQTWADPNYSGHLSLFLNFLGKGDDLEVPDPYYGGEDSFELVLDMVEEASSNLLAHIVDTHFDDPDLSRLSKVESS